MRVPSFTTALVSLCLLTPGVVAQGGKDQPGKDQGKKAAGEAMAMPKPGPEHEHFKSAAGTWNATVETPDQPAVKGVSEMSVILGGFWLADHFTCDWNGMKFEGHGTTGYDPIKGKFVSTWIDNMNPAMLVTEGTFDAKTKTMTMTGDGYDMQGQKVKVRTVTTHKDANTVVFEMYHTGADNKEAKAMTITYTRQDKGAAK